MPQTPDNYVALVQTSKWETLTEASRTRRIESRDNESAIAETQAIADDTCGVVGLWYIALGKPIHVATVKPSRLVRDDYKAWQRERCAIDAR